jgi:hypothetical protein
VTENASSAYSLRCAAVALRLAPGTVISGIKIISSGTHNPWSAALLIFEENIARFACFAC